MQSPRRRTNISVRVGRLLPLAATTGLCIISHDLRCALVISVRQRDVIGGSLQGFPDVNSGCFSGGGSLVHVLHQAAARSREVSSLDADNPGENLPVRHRSRMMRDSGAVWADFHGSGHPSRRPYNCDKTRQRNKTQS
jgi:hypothetical protein